MTTSKLANCAIIACVLFEMVFILFISVVAVVYVIGCLIIMFNQIERLTNVYILPVQLLSFFESMFMDHHKIE
jgi:hypothetical protein